MGEGACGLTSRLNQLSNLDVDVNTLKQNNDNTSEDNGEIDNDKSHLEEKERNNLEPSELGESLNESEGKTAEDRDEKDPLNSFQSSELTEETENQLQTSDCEMLINNLLHQLK